MTRASKGHFGHTKLVVDDLERTAAFYSEVCGLVERGRADATMQGKAGSEIMFAPTAEGGAMFALVKFFDSPKPPSNDVLLGFMTADLEDFCARVESAGGQVTHAIETVAEHGVKVAYVTDVEGNALEVLQLL